MSQTSAKLAKLWLLVEWIKIEGPNVYGVVNWSKLVSHPPPSKLRPGKEILVENNASPHPAIIILASENKEYLDSELSVLQNIAANNLQDKTKANKNSRNLSLTTMDKVDKATQTDLEGKRWMQNFENSPLCEVIDKLIKRTEEMSECMLRQSKLNIYMLATMEEINKRLLEVESSRNAENVANSGGDLNRSTRNNVVPIIEECDHESGEMELPEAGAAPALPWLTRNYPDDMVPIGSGQTLIPLYVMNQIDWSNLSETTRTLLREVFSRKSLATQSLSGKQKKGSKTAGTKLDPRKVKDIVETVSKYNGSSKRKINQVISTTCADEKKMRLAQMDNENVASNNKVSDDKVVNE